MTLQSRQNLIVCGCVAAAVLLLNILVYAIARGAMPAPGPRIAVALIDTVKCWCSPLWGHNAAKVVEGKNGETWVAIYSGTYPEGSLEIHKKSPEGRWERGGILPGGYQPPLLFVDEAGRLNMMQNSQTGPITHLRATDDEGLKTFTLVAAGNGQEDGRGWYVGTGIHKGVLYMSYITLDYNLFLTWKQVLDTSWAPAVLIHKGSVDAKAGNHSWTRPDFQFDDRLGYLVVNETSDGSLKNTYNAVHMISFDLTDPHQFHTEEIARVPLGFGAYSPDFVLTPDGWMHCVVRWGNRIYETDSQLEGGSGVYVFSRPSNGQSWISRRVFDTVTDCGLVWGSDGSVMAVRVVRGDDTGVVEVMRSADHGATWSCVAAERTADGFKDLSHLQFASNGSNWGAKFGRVGVFQDRWQKLSETKNPLYGIYLLQVSEQ